MRKITILFLLIALVLSATIVSAAPVSELNHMARFFTADNLFVFSIRLDDGYIDTLDDVVERVMRFLPAEAQMPLGIRDLLNQGLAGENLGTFEETIRPWLGDTLTLGTILTEASVMENEDPQVLIAVAVDGAGARTFFDQATTEAVTAGDVLVTEANGMKMYLQADQDLYIGITADTLFISSTKAGLPVEGVENPISADPIFTETLALLPAADYNISLFINTPVLQELMLGAIEAESQQAMPDFLQRLSAVNGAQAIGFTILGGDTLTMDIVQKVDTSAFSELGVEMTIPDSLDPAFINRIPAGTPLAVAIADFGPLLQSGYSNLRAIADAIDAQGGLIPLLEEAQVPLTESDYQSLQALDPAMLLGVVNTSFASATGLSLELDFLPAFTGDAALYARSVAVDDFIAPIAPELGFIAEASDSQRALSVVDALTTAATGFDLPATNEAFGDGQALVIPSSEDTTGIVYPGLDILFGAGNGVIALGTRGAAQAALTAEGGLVDDPAFQAASEHFLNDTQVLLYLNSVPLFEALDSLIAAQLVPVDTDFAIGYTALSLIESASITSTSRADGVSMIRMAITLGEEPRPFQSAASTSIDSVLAAPYADIPQSRTADGAFVLGNPDARVTVVLFEDFLCPHCQNYQPEVQAFIERHVVTGEAKIEFRMVVAVDQTYSALAFQLAECSDLLAPGGFWAAHDQIFRIASASRFNDGSVEQLATALGVNSSDLLTCAKTAEQWQIDGSVAQDYGVIGTPTIAWRLDNGAMQAAPLSSRPTADELSELVRQYLRSS